MFLWLVRLDKAGLFFGTCGGIAVTLPGSSDVECLLAFEEVEETDDRPFLVDISIFSKPYLRFPGNP